MSTYAYSNASDDYSFYDDIGIRPFAAPRKLPQTMTLSAEDLLSDFFKLSVYTRRSAKKSKIVKICATSETPLADDGEKFVVHHNFPLELLNLAFPCLKNCKLVERDVPKPELRLPKASIDFYYMSNICDWLLETADLNRNELTNCVFKARDLTDMLWLRDTLKWLELDTAMEKVAARLPAIIKAKAPTVEDVSSFFEVTQYSSGLVDTIFDAMAFHEAQDNLPEVDNILRFLEEKHRRIFPRYLRARIDNGCEGAVEQLRALNEEYYYGDNKTGKHKLSNPSCPVVLIKLSCSY